MVSTEHVVDRHSEAGETGVDRGKLLGAFDVDVVGEAQYHPVRRERQVQAARQE